MPNKPAAKKYLRKSEARRTNNRAIKENLKKLVKNTRRFIVAKNIEKAQKSLQMTTKALDKAAQHGIIKKNKASRDKSRLMLAYNKTKKAAT